MNLTAAFNGASNGGLLMEAVKNGNSEIVKWLLENGADVNAAAAPDDAGPAGPPLSGAPAPEGESSTAKHVTTMATERQVKAPPTARFRKKRQKRVTTL